MDMDIATVVHAHAHAAFSVRVEPYSDSTLTALLKWSYSCSLLAGGNPHGPACGTPLYPHTLPNSDFNTHIRHMATCAFRQTRQQPLRKCSLSLSLSLSLPAPYYATVLRVAMRSQARQSTEAAAWQELTRTTLQSTRRQRLSLSPHCPHVPSSRPRAVTLPTVCASYLPAHRVPSPHRRRSTHGGRHARRGSREAARCL